MFPAIMSTLLLLLVTPAAPAEERTLGAQFTLNGGVRPNLQGFRNAKKHKVREARLRVDQSYPFYLRYGDRYLLLIGASDRQALTIWRSNKGFDWRRYLGEIAAHGFNYVRQDAAAWTGLSGFRRHPAQFSSPRWAFVRTGPGTAVDGQPRFDLTRLDEGYFRERLIPFLREAERQGIIVELTLFEDCRGRRDFVESLYAETNNVNALGLKPGDDPHSDAALDNQQLLAVQEGYVTRVLQATAEFGNVVYEVANETGGARWVAHLVEFIHQRRPGALVSAGEQSSPYDPVAGGCDLVVKHRGRGGLYAADEDVARHRHSLIMFRQGGKPVLHNEFFLFANRSTDDPNFVRKMFWADFTGGGHANFYDFTWWRGTERTVGEGSRSQPPPPEILNAGQFLRRFVEQGQVPFESMGPHDEFAKAPARDGVHPFVFAQPGVVYVVYLIRGGAVTLDIATGTATFTARWFDPRNGNWRKPFETHAGESREFKAPSKDDWVLHLRKGAEGQ